MKKKYILILIQFLVTFGLYAQLTINHYHEVTKGPHSFEMNVYKTDTFNLENVVDSSMHHTTYHVAYSTDGKVIEEEIIDSINGVDSLYNRLSYKYDDNNRLTTKMKFLKSKKLEYFTVYRRNENGDLLKEITKTAKGKVLKEDKYVYSKCDSLVDLKKYADENYKDFYCVVKDHDNSTKILEEIFVYGDDLIIDDIKVEAKNEYLVISDKKYTYDSKKQLIETNSSATWGQYIVKYEYDEFGNVTMDQSGSFIARFKYAYDEHNNWTKCIKTYSEDTAKLIFTRKFKY